MKVSLINTLILSILCSISLMAQHSVAREWNEAILNGVRNDFARPTIHARNLLHSSIAMYDAWAAYTTDNKPFFLGNTWGNYNCNFTAIEPSNNTTYSQETAMSYAVYRLLKHRFADSPGKASIYAYADSLMLHLGYDTTYTNTDYLTKNPAALGNYIAQELIAFGLQDGSNEINDYENQYYYPRNPALAPTIPGNRLMFNENRWQPLTFDLFIDQAGNPIPGFSPPFLSPEWGNVVSFSLKEEDKVTYKRTEGEYQVYHDPGAPPLLNIDEKTPESEEYQWNFTLVAKWAAHLDPSDSIFWDISPASIGNIAEEDYPTIWEALRAFYPEQGGDLSRGHALNPYTGKAYEPQIVPRGDYARVLAEFWADGPDSETPPGHWFTILNYVSDQAELIKQFRGEGEILSDLEWDVKAYLCLGGAMHDAAIAAWSVKGWYDYPRPISVLRAMSYRGQSTSPDLPRFDPGGMPLIPGYIEMVNANDPLAGENGENIDKIKLYTWRGPNYIQDPEHDMAGVGWILADDWWPYQQPNFVTPPFAGYVSGHSTFSRAAAEVLTLLTGDAFFPGGLGEFEIKKNEFLEFEDGPSVDMTLQWATYRDASEQTSLSRIWGGIHPPIDDIPGRLMGQIIGIDAFEKAASLFEQLPTSIEGFNQQDYTAIMPNPAKKGQHIQVVAKEAVEIGRIFSANGQFLHSISNNTPTFSFNIPTDLSPGIYWIELIGKNWNETKRVIIH